MAARSLATMARSQASAWALSRATSPAGGAARASAGAIDAISASKAARRDVMA
jgi:hypothetical protein